LRDHERAVTDEQRPNDVLGGLPRTRPHRRSDKRKPPAGAASQPGRAPKPKAATLKAPTPKAKARATAKAKTTPAKNAPASRKPAPLRDASAKPKAKRERLRQPAQPAGTPARGPASARSPARRSAPEPPRRAAPPSGGQIVSTAVQAAAELAEIGLTASARALRTALSRLPRP
jgi:hypothetical protein